MKWKQIEDQPETFALIFDTGDELNAGLTGFAKEQNLSDASSIPFFRSKARKEHEDAERGQSVVTWYHFVRGCRTRSRWLL